MLKLLGQSDLPELLDFCKGSINGTRIASYALSYGFDKEFLTLWGSWRVDKFNSVVAKFENTMTVLALDDSDFFEIKEFINIIGADEIITEKSTAELLGFSEFDVKQGFCYNTKEKLSFFAEQPLEDDFKEIYTLICAAIPNSFKNTREAYLSFLSDFTYRQRREFAKSKCIKKEGRVVACGLTSAQSYTDALLSGIACDENYRKYGYGKTIVLSIAEELKNENKNAFVIALNSSAEGFYKHIGFSECEKIAFIRRKVQ